MKLIKAKDYKDMSRKAANFLSAQVILKENSVLGLATGGTSEGIYEQLVEWYRKGDIDFSSVSTVNLDEYVGLDGMNEQSYRYFMKQHLFSHINIKEENCHLPDGMADNIEDECIRYDRLIEQLGGIDMQLLGIGENGHIGFNEPDEAFEQMTHCIRLKEGTIEANSRYFASKEEVPRRAVTMGIKAIMQARAIVLCASGAKKAEILNKVLYGPVTPEVPGSVLQMHPRLIVVADEEALAGQGK